MESPSPTLYSERLKQLSSEYISRTEVETIIFETALTVYDTNTPDRWQKVAALVPGKTASDVMEKYKDFEGDHRNRIEAGLVQPIPKYRNCNNNNNVGQTKSIGHKRSAQLSWSEPEGPTKPTKKNTIARKPASSKLTLSEPESPSSNKRKRDIWTLEDHMWFLRGIETCGVGAWKEISKKFLPHKKTIQISSHAQKHRIRIATDGVQGKRRRASIHDIRLVHLSNRATNQPQHAILGAVPLTINSLQPNTVSYQPANFTSRTQIPPRDQPPNGNNGQPASIEQLPQTGYELKDTLQLDDATHQLGSTMQQFEIEEMINGLLSQSPIFMIHEPTDKTGFVMPPEATSATSNHQ